MSNIVTTNNSTPSLKRFNQTITDVKTQDYLQQVLGERKSSFTNNIVALVANNTKLQECEPMSLMYSAIKATSLELPIDANLGFAYFIPYKNNAKGITEAQFQMGYKGFVQLAMRSGKYKIINVTDVREGELKHRDLLTGELQFEIESDREKKDIIGYVAFFELINGFRKCLYMTTDEIKAHAKQYSKTYSFKDGLWNANFNAMAMKGLALETIIPTPDGYTTMGEIKVGDKLFNTLGEITTVVAKSEVKNLPCYEVELSNNEVVVCDEEHRWFVKGTDNRADWVVMETKEMYAAKSLGYPIVMPRTNPVKMEEKKLIIDPYILGYWLGNGSHGAATIACHEDDSDEIISKFEKFYEVNTRHDDRSRCMILNISSKTNSRSDMSSLKQQIKHIGVYKNKHIPIDYKRASIEQRIELIRGLCDSDGCVENTNRGRVTYSSVKRGLIEDMYEVLCSLGERPAIHTSIARGYGTTTTCYSIQWKPQNFIPFHLKRKTERCKDRLITRNINIKSIRKIDSVPTQCIAVDSGDSNSELDLRRSFLVGYGFIPTHNTVLKLLLSKYGILSIEMQDAVKYDQAVIRDENGTPNYVDNTAEIIEDVQAEIIEEQGAKKIAIQPKETKETELF